MKRRHHSRFNQIRELGHFPPRVVATVKSPSFDIRKSIGVLPPLVKEGIGYQAPDAGCQAGAPRRVPVCTSNDNTNNDITKNSKPLKDVQLDGQVLLGILLELGEEVPHRLRTVAQIVIERGIGREFPQGALAVRHAGGDRVEPAEDVVGPVDRQGDGA